MAWVRCLIRGENFRIDPDGSALARVVEEIVDDD